MVSLNPIHDELPVALQLENSTPAIKPMTINQATNGRVEPRVWRWIGKCNSPN